jgi:hypothetical protein
MRAPSLFLLALLAASPAACAYRPARFADAPAVIETADDAPIPVPGRRDPVKEIYFAEAYLHRPAALALDPSRPATAGDINALDEVPRSSWFDPTREDPDEEQGPPIAPFSVVLSDPESGQGGLAISDVRRIRYELARDPPARPELRTAGAALSARLFNAVGWRAPEVHVVTIVRHELRTSSPAGAAVADAFMQQPLAPSGSSSSASTISVMRSNLRVRAMRWPVGIDVGPTPVGGTRDGDPNDRVPHTERRTLRALKLMLFWIGANRLDPNALHDSYEGQPGAGHLLHWIVGLDDALGANAVNDEEDARLGGEGRSFGANALTAFVTLGLGLRHPPPLQTSWPALGDYQVHASPARFEPQPPFEPFDRLLPADSYWAAKRIAAVSDADLRRAVASAQMSDAASAARALFVLEARRSSLLAWAFAAVTPAEIESISEERLTLRDEAIARGLEPAATSAYAIDFLDGEGSPLSPPLHLTPKGALIEVPLPSPRTDYLIVRASVRRGRHDAARPCELHLVHDRRGTRVVGLRH